jgi:hypothetical protein
MAAPLAAPLRALLSALALARASSTFPCGLPPPQAPPGALLNNTRLYYSAAQPAPFVSASAELCLAHCVADSTCGGLTFREPYEPLPVFGCEGKAPSDGCCYPAPLLGAYQLVGPGDPASFGFVSAVVRPGAPAPPLGVPPAWLPTYEMNASISLYWRNASGLEPAEFYDGYGLVMFDWAHAAQYWINNFSPMDNAAGLSAQCSLIKARNNGTRCVVYRNTAIALNQHRHISSVLDDDAFAGFFLRFKPGATQTGACWGEEDPRQKGSPWDPIWPTPAVCATPLPSDVHVPMCDKAAPGKCNRVHYFDQNQCPQVPGDNWSNDTMDVYQGLVCNGATCDCGLSPCGEFLFNFTNSSMVDWWLLEHMGGGMGLDHPAVDGVLLDDYWDASAGPSEIDSNMLADMGMSAADTAAMTASWQAAMGRLYDLAATRSKFVSNMGYSGDSLSYSSAAQCTARLTSMCSATDPTFGHWYVVNYEYVQPPVFGITPVNTLLDVAYFLLTRGPWAWIAGGPMLGWHMSHWWTAGQDRRINFRSDLRPAEFDADYGEPLCSCTQTEPGVFVRQWSKAVVTINCTALQGRIDFGEAT